MRFVVIAESVKFRHTMRNLFSAIHVSPACLWLTVSTAITESQIRHQFPSNTVLLKPGTGAPTLTFVDGMFVITAEVVNTYDAFTAALSLLHQLQSTCAVDIIAIVPFGPTTFSTAIQMRDAWVDTRGMMVWTPIPTNLWTPTIYKK